MGAVTALRYLGSRKKHQVKVAIFDSPFQSLRQLFLEIGKEKTNLPKIVLEVAYKYLKPIIQEKADFNIDDVDLTLDKQDPQCPGIFIASKNDSLIPFRQIDKIFKNYKDQKEMFFIDESHNESRNLGVIRKVFKACEKYFVSRKSIEDIKLNYYSFIPRKIQEPPRKKLELTIKSYSQKVLNVKQEQTPKKNIHEGSQPHLEKRQISGLFTRKSSTKLYVSKEKKEYQIDVNRFSLQTRRKPISIKKFFREEDVPPIPANKENQNQIKFKPKIEWDRNLLKETSYTKLQKNSEKKNIKI